MAKVAQNSYLITSPLKLPPPRLNPSDVQTILAFRRSLISVDGKKEEEASSK